MMEKEVTVQNKTGLHARPAAMFVQKAGKFSSTITVVKEEREANAKSIMSVMALGAGQGSKVVIRAEGPDEEEAVTTLVELVESFAE